MRDAPNPGREESEHERLDRNLVELLNELRVVLPGVQVLFAFLLAVPFNQRFGETNDFQRDVYLVTLFCTAMATILLIAPSALHRIEFRHNDKRHIVTMANRYVIGGLAFLMPSLTGVVLLVTDFLYSTATAVVATSVALGSIVVFWGILPLRRRSQLRREEAGQSTPSA